MPDAATRYCFGPFGFSLAAGDFGFGPEDDLAVGVPGENSEAGAVNIIYGSAWGGLTYANAQLLQQGSNGLAGGSESGDRFGFSLAAGDFNLNGFADLAVGSLGEDIGAPDAGVVHVLYGGRQAWTPIPVRHSGRTGGTSIWRALREHPTSSGGRWRPETLEGTGQKE
jgi:hypothetical protein